MSDPTSKYPSFRKEGSFTVVDCKKDFEREGHFTFYIEYRSDTLQGTFPVRARTQSEAIEACRKFVRAKFTGGKA